MTANPKQRRIQDKKYRASFKIYREHRCLITGAEFTEFGSESVDGAHIRLGCFSGGKKPSDDLILPLVHRLHLDFDRKQEKFILETKQHFILWGESFGVYWMDFTGTEVEYVKACARAYYEDWREK